MSKRPNAEGDGQDKAPSGGLQTQPHRLVFDVTARTYQKLLQIREESGARSNSEVIRNSLRAYAWLVKQVRSGYTIRLVKDGEVVKDVDIDLMD